MLTKDTLLVLCNYLDKSDILKLRLVFRKFEYILFIKSIETTIFDYYDALLFIMYELREKSRDLTKHIKKIKFDNDNSKHFQNLKKTFSNLTYLNFGDNFNKKISKGDLPDSLEYLIFGKHFDQPIKRGDLPSSLKLLTFGDYFDKQLKKGDLPNSLIELNFGIYFDKMIINGVLPNSLKYLTVGYCNDPERVHKSIYFDKKTLPKLLTHLTLGPFVDIPIDKGVLPNSLTHLTFGDNFNQEIYYIGVLQNSLIYVSFGVLFDQQITQGKLPISLKKLNIRRMKNTNYYIYNWNEIKLSKTIEVEIIITN